MKKYKRKNNDLQTITQNHGVNSGAPEGYTVHCKIYNDCD